MNTLGVFPACFCSRCTSLLAARVFQAYACGNTQVFTSREYLELTLVVNIQVSRLKSVSSSACGEFSCACENKLSRLESVSSMHLLGIYKPFPISKVFQACACGGHTNLLLYVPSRLENVSVLCLC